ncbi:MAG: hypothetical protein ACE5FA_01460 [Dehalococcoidia bacterium]
MSEAAPPIETPTDTAPASGPTLAPDAAPLAPSNWRESLPADLKDNAVLAKIPDVAALAKEHVNVQKLIGVDKIAAPREDWGDEEWGQLFSRLGRPDSAEDYDLGEIERPKDIPWDEGFEKTMMGAMHTAGLTTQQVQKLFGSYIESIQGQWTAAQGDVERQTQEQLFALRTELGKSFDSHVDYARRAIRYAAGDGYEELANLQLASGGRLGDHPAVIKAFAKIGSSMGEDGLVGKKQTRMTLNPAEAQQEIQRLRMDEGFMKAYLSGDHPEHAAAVQKMNDLYESEIVKE